VSRLPAHEEWVALDGLLDAALDRSPAERTRFLREACGEDHEKRKRLERLVAWAEQEDDRLTPSRALAGPLIEELAGGLAASPGDDLLAPGTELGPYRVVGHLGSGGVGRVYRALDPQLGREVAIKALASAFHDDSASLRRFEREARALAALNHPNIATLYELLEVDGRPYLVLELVEGETLAERLGRGAMPVAEAVEAARQIGDALAEAHRKGIVHRDLKPSNVKLGEDGRVKVLDFGLAKTAPGPGAGDARTATTLSGTILGTAPYMSPEQARGLATDRRTDIWAFGCLLFEMLSGVRAFGGRTVSDVLAAVLRDEPDYALLPPATPSHLVRLVKRCLRKDPGERLKDIAHVRADLDQASTTTAALPARGESRAARPALRWLLAGALVAVVGVAAGAAFLRPRPPGAEPVRLGLDPGVPLDDGFASPFALSPDGKTAVLVAREETSTRLLLRRLDRFDARALDGTEGARQPFFSPDGTSVAFFADRKLVRLPLAGGSPVVLAEVGSNPRGGSWGPDGTIVVGLSQTSGLYRVKANGGPLEPLTRLDLEAGESSHRWPQVLPGGRWVLFSVLTEGSSWDDAALEVVSLESGERRLVQREAAFGLWAGRGPLVFARAGRLWAASFDPDRLATRSPPEVVLEGLAYDPRNGASKVALSSSGTLLYACGRPTSLENHLAWVDAEGRVTRLPGAPRRFREPRLSPGGGRLVVRIGGAEDAEAWTFDLASGTLVQVTSGLSPRRPAWSPDGAHLVAGSRTGGRWSLFAVRASGGDRVVLYESANRVYPTSFTPDGRLLVFQEQHPERGWDLRALPLGDGLRPVGKPRDLAAGPANETNGVVSPDGRLLAFETDELDAVVQVYVSRFPDGGGKVQVTRDGGRFPRWSSTAELVYLRTPGREPRRVALRERDGRVLPAGEAPFWPDATAALQARASLFIPNYLGYDVDAAHRRLIVLEEAARSEAPSPPGLRVVLGWLDEVSTRPSGPG
jgi:eukaryotic-like serine/threonine-protein kinase